MKKTYSTPTLRTQDLSEVQMPICASFSKGDGAIEQLSDKHGWNSDDWSSADEDFDVEE